MTDSYSIKFSNGDQGFEVQGPDQAWVAGKASEMQALLEATPVRSSNAEEKQKRSTRKSSSLKSTGKKNGDTAVSPLTEKWSDELPAQITAFVTERQTAFDSGATKQAAILAVFLKDNLGIESITAEDMEMIYRQLGWKTINHVGQLNNAYQRNKYFSVKDGSYTLTYAGLQYGRDGAKASGSGK